MICLLAVDEEVNKKRGFSLLQAYQKIIKQELLSPCFFDTVIFSRQYELCSTYCELRHTSYSDLR